MRSSAVGESSIEFVFYGHVLYLIKEARPQLAVLLSKGNNYRLIVGIDYENQTVYYKFRKLPNG